MKALLNPKVNDIYNIDVQLKMTEGANLAPTPDIFVCCF